MIGVLQGENRDLNKKYLKQKSKRVGDSTHGSLALKAYQQNLYLEYYY